jgi:phosphoglycerate dehydrogenase-like enzyme
MQKAVIFAANHLETTEIVDRLINLITPMMEMHGIKAVVCRDADCALREIEDADMMFGYRILPEMLQRAKRLKWIQFGSAGIDHTIFPELLASDIILTTFSGVHPVPTAEHVLGLMLALSRRFHTAIQQQMEHCWDRSTIAGSAGELHGKVVGIVGLGKIGLQIAKLAKAFDMKVIGTKATLSGRIPNVDEVFMPNALHHMLQLSDFTVLVVPLTNGTTALLGPKEIEIMKPGSSLINVARGQMVDNNALIQALESGHLSGAALDVFYPEPLPADSPLWDAPNTIITPHTGGSTPMYAERGAEIFRKNLEAFLSGGEMFTTYNRAKGY